jgi:hypothetical protein
VLCAEQVEMVNRADERGEHVALRQPIIDAFRSARLLGGRVNARR